MARMRLLKLMLIVLFLNTSFIFAQAPQVKPIPLGVPGKQPGDIIAPVNDSQIASWCDFTKTIVVTRTNVLCVYAGYRPTTPGGL